MVDNDVKDWIKEVVANGYHGHMRPIEEDVLDYFYESLSEDEYLQEAVYSVLRESAQCVIADDFQYVVVKAIERTTSTFETSVAAHLREQQEIFGD